MKKYFNTFLTVFAIVFAIPSFLILISWNSLPGDFLYPLKTSLEDVALAITIKTPLASMFSINFTQRRFSEANRLLAKKGSSVGYSLLVAEASESKEIILGQADTAKAKELSAKIEEYKKNIEEKKLALQAQPQSILPPASEQKRVCIQVVTPAKNTTTGECREFPTPCDIPSGWIKVVSCETGSTPMPTGTAKTPSSTSQAATPTPEVATPEPVDEIVEELEQTQEELEDIQDELEDQIQSQPQSVQEENGGKREDKNHERDDRREEEPSSERPQKD